MKFAKVASNLHTNPKVFKAGRNAREVYLWALCKNAELELDGVIPASYLDPSIVTVMLHANVTDVTEGLQRSVSFGLLEALEDGSYRIAGWGDDWRPSATASERARAYRARKKQAVTAPPVTDRHVTQRDARDANAGEESRGEERREERERERRTGGVSPPAEKPRKPRREPETPLPADWKPSDAHRELAAELGVNLEREATSFRDHAETHARRAARWDAAFRLWLRKAQQFGPARPRDSSDPPTYASNPYKRLVPRTAGQ